MTATCSAVCFRDVVFCKADMHRGSLAWNMFQIIHPPQEVFMTCLTYSSANPSLPRDNIPDINQVYLTIPLLSYRELEEWLDVEIFLAQLKKNRKDIL